MPLNYLLVAQKPYYHSQKYGAKDKDHLRCESLEQNEVNQLQHTKNPDLEEEKERKKITLAKVNTIDDQNLQSFLLKDCILDCFCQHLELARR